MTGVTGYSLSRQGSFSTRSSVPISALMASMEASKVARDENTTIANDHINIQAKNYLQSTSGPSLSRQSSRNEKQQVDSPFGVAASRHMNGAAEIQKSESSNLRRRSSLKHSESGYKLERKVSFHHRDQIIGDSSKSMIVDENGVPVEGGEKKEKKKRTKEEKEARRKEKDEKRARKEARRAAREMSVTRSASEQMPAPVAVMAVNGNNAGVKTHVQGEQLLEQVSAKLVNHLQESGASCGSVPSSSLFPEYGVQASRKQDNNSASLTSDQSRTQAQKTTSSNPHDTDPKQLTKSEAGGSSGERPRKGPAPQPPVVNDLVCLEDTEAGPSSVVLREHNTNTEDSRNCSKRNSLDNKSVATLAKDLAAECAKAYELMESSLSKLTNDFSIGPFGLTPKTKVSWIF